MRAAEKIQVCCKKGVNADRTRHCSGCEYSAPLSFTLLCRTNHEFAATTCRGRRLVLEEQGYWDLPDWTSQKKARIDRYEEAQNDGAVIIGALHESVLIGLAFIKPIFIGDRPGMYQLSQIVVNKRYRNNATQEHRRLNRETAGIRLNPGGT